MRARVFTVRLDPESRVFDDRPLVAFLDANEALGIAHHAVIVDGEPAIAVVVTTRGVGERRPMLPTPPRDRTPQSATAIELADGDRALYESLRTWRNDRARRDGRPAYVMFTNGQLAAVATRRPASLTQLREIPGVGEARVDAYGEELLGIIGTASDTAQSEPGPRAADE